MFWKPHFTISILQRFTFKIVVHLCYFKRYIVDNIVLHFTLSNDKLIQVNYKESLNKSSSNIKCSFFCKYLDIKDVYIILMYSL